MDHSAPKRDVIESIYTRLHKISGGKKIIFGVYMRKIKLYRFILLRFFIGFFLVFVPIKSPADDLKNSFSSIILTEIMFNPAGSEHYDEFVEIFNISETDSVYLAGWSIGDGSGFDEIIDAGSGLTLAPGQIGLILDSGYFDHSTSYDSLIPGQAIVLTIDGATFGQRGWSNSTETTVLLRDNANQVVNQYSYMPGNRPGYSVEKIDLYGNNSPLNWGGSSVLLGTPGFKNSISPKQNDIALLLTEFPEQVVDINSSWPIVFQIKNKGINPASKFQLSGYVYLNYPNPDSNLVYNHIYEDTLKYGEQLDWEVFLEADKPGIWEYHFFLDLVSEENSADNYVSYNIIIPFRTDDLLINEILYYPEIDESEWLEIYNNSPYQINLAGWSFAREQDLSRAGFLSEETSILDIGGFYVVTRDSVLSKIEGDKWIFIKDFPSLPDGGSEIYLTDPSDKIIESAAYDPVRGKKRGFSLERVWYEKSGLDSSNWQLSYTKGGTPGLFNSSSPFETDIAVTDLFVVPNPADYQAGVELQVFLKNIGRKAVSDIKLFIYLDTNYDSIPQNEELVIPGRNLIVSLNAEDIVVEKFNVPKLVSGIYNLIVQAIVEGDQKVENNYGNVEVKIGYAPGNLVFNEILYQPSAGKPEWLEVYNRDQNMVNIRDWLISELPSGKSYKITTETIFIYPGSFCVISSDSNISVPENATLIVAKNFPHLNNDGEHLQLSDFSGVVIDSLYFSSRWGGELDVSLERINPDFSSRDSSNWASSTAISGQTPGEKNSVFVSVLPSDLIFSIYPNPFSPDGDGHEDITVIQYDLPMTTAYVNLNVYDMMGRPVCELLNTVPSGSLNEVLWNGKKNNGESLRIGVYIIFLEALNRELGVIRIMKQPIVIAGKL